MRNLDTAIDAPTEPQVTAEDETIVAPCPQCSRDVTRVLPAGTARTMADLLRRMAVTCTECSERLEAEEQAKRDAAQRALRVESCDLPVMLRGLTWDSYDVDDKNEKAVAAAKAWAAGVHSKRGLLLTGPVGSGKTRLSATAVWAALDRIGVRYVNVAELIVKMSAGFGDRDRQNALRVLTGRGPIVLDDLDKVNPSMHVLSNLYTAIDGRVQAGASMIVTTNLRPSELITKFSRAGGGEDAAERRVAAEAIVSRLRGHCTVHLIDGRDRRG